MSRIAVNWSNHAGTIKPVHGVGQPPLLGHDFSMFRYLKEANIPFSRLHDVGGWFGGNMYVDIPNLFRDFDADPSDPEAYDFVFTDLLLAQLAKVNVEPFFRLGVTIENFAPMKSYRLDPPKDFMKWAKICEGIIRHYTEGWANGFHYNIRYWEIWNEPDNYEEMNENCMWRGTKEQYYAFYDVAASYLKKQFPHLKIGGYASCGFYAMTGKAVSAANSTPRFDYFLSFFDGFLDYISAHGSPLDFFSWHSYAAVEDTIVHAAYARRRLDEAGYKDTETICNEWNWACEKRGTAEHAAYNTAMLIAFQHSPLDSAMFYDARISPSVYGGLFDPMSRLPFPLYYGFKAFGALYALGMEVEVLCDTPDIYVLAASNDEKGALLLVNLGEETPLQLELGGMEITSCRIINQTKNEEPCPLPARIDKYTMLYIETK